MNDHLQLVCLQLNQHPAIVDSLATCALCSETVAITSASLKAFQEVVASEPPDTPHRIVCVSCFVIHSPIEAAMINPPSVGQLEEIRNALEQRRTA